jgi:TatD DNase family protein
MIFESHAHYDDEAFDEDREVLLGSLKEHGIGTVINVGASLASCRSTMELAEKYPFIYAAIGVHPSDTAELTQESIAWMEELCRNPKVVAVGEIGLDYHWPEPSGDIQKRWFIEQLRMARRTHLPAIIHSRESAKDTLDIMQGEKAEEIGGVIHCYSYTKEMAREYLQMGFYFGIGGVITFKNSRKLREAVEYIPVDRILLETDSPYLSPEPYRGKRNSSLHLPYVAEAIAQIKGMTAQEIITITENNAKALFGLQGEE